MEEQTIDIVSIIENNPITSLKSSTQTKLMNTVKNEFKNNQQQLFIGSFYCYLNHHPTNDYVVDLDNIWKWLGFNRINDCKRVLTKYFKENDDYKITLCNSAKRKNEGGFNKEQIMMNIKTFKKLCLKTRTDKADEIHEYYLKLEELIQETLKEQTEEYEQEVKALKQEINAIKDLKYEEANKTGYVYIISTDIPNRYKVGKSIEPDSRRKRLQSNCINIIEVLYKFHTCDETLLENLVHQMLYRYRTNGHYEIFSCNLDYIKNIIDFVGNMVNTLKSSYDTINKTELFNIFNKKLENNNDSHLCSDKIKYPTIELNLEEHTHNVTEMNKIHGISINASNSNHFNPQIYKKFIESCYIINNESYEPIKNLLQQFRIYLTENELTNEIQKLDLLSHQGTERTLNYKHKFYIEFKNAISNILNIKFTAYQYNENGSNMSICAIKGICLKNSPINYLISINHYENYFKHIKVVQNNSKILTKDLLKHFHEYLITNNIIEKNDYIKENSYNTHGFDERFKTEFINIFNNTFKLKEKRFRTGTTKTNRGYSGITIFN